MSFKKITVAGIGTLGSQIAFQIAFRGFPVIAYDIDKDVVEKKARQRIEEKRSMYKRDIKATDAQFDAGLKHLSYTLDLKKAVSDADLLIEAIPEVEKTKRDFYRHVSSLAPKKTVFASNSSTIIPSRLAPASDRPEKFVNFHFANQIWYRNTAEIMGGPKTKQSIKDQMAKFAREIGMIPIILQKEIPGYILNALLVPWFNGAMSVWAQEGADAKTIDKTWMVVLKSPMGPFGMLDIVGLRTVYNIQETMAKGSNDPTKKAIVGKLKKMIDSGKIGEESGEGFYRYPHPAYEDPNFLKS